MSSLPRPVDLTQVPTVPWAWVDERVYATIRGCSVKVTTVRYKLGDITAFMESQPGGGGTEKPSNQSTRERGRPRRIST